jgi:hypothetical protein
VFAVLGAAMAGVTVSGCGDDTVEPGPDAAGDVQVDSTQPDVSQPDVTQPDVSAEAAPQDGSSQDATHPDATPDAQSDAPLDVAQDVSHPDAPPDAPADVQPQDARPDASDAGSADVVVDSSPEAAPQGDAGDAGDASDSGTASEAGCTTTIGELNDAGTSMLLIGFDTSAEIVPWTSYTFPTNVSTNVESYSPTDGPSGFGCPGALSLALTYTAYGVNSGLDRFYTSGGGATQDWTGRVRLHFWVKVVTSDYTTINGLEEFVQSGSTLKQYSPFLTGSSLAGGGWVQSVVDLTPGANFDPTTVAGFEVQLQTIAAGIDGGPAAPPAATVLVDDIWLE